MTLYVLLLSPGILFDSSVQCQPVGAIYVVEKQLGVYECRAPTTSLDSQMYPHQTVSVPVMRINIKGSDAPQARWVICKK